MKTSKRHEDLGTLVQRRDQFLEELAACGDWIRGSLVESKRPVSKQSGKKSSPKEGAVPFRYLSRSHKGRNKITYIKDKEVRVFRQGIAEFEKASGLMRQISELNVQIVKAGGTLEGSRRVQRSKGGRS